MIDLFSVEEIQKAGKLVRPAAPKTARVLECLEQGYRLTVGDALRMCGVYALSQECGRLRKLGWPVRSTWKETAPGTRVKEYFL